ncbi:MAG: hypothetical protein AAB922_03005 [Patescibacteria group bacterium]
MQYKSFKPQSNFYKLSEGENKLRLVGEAEMFISEYQGKPTTRFAAYVIDRVDGQVKPFTFGSQIMGQIASLANGSEYGFDDLPPYDLIVHKTGSGMATEYKVTPARKDTALTQEEEKAVAELKPITELAQKLSNKVVAGEQNNAQPPIESYEENEISVADIPF